MTKSNAIFHFAFDFFKQIVFSRAAIDLKRKVNDLARIPERLEENTKKTNHEKTGKIRTVENFPFFHIYQQETLFYNKKAALTWYPKTPNVKGAF